MYSAMGTLAMASAMMSSGRSSSFLKRMQLLPMSSFLPAAAKDFSIHACMPGTMPGVIR